MTLVNLLSWKLHFWKIEFTPHFRKYILSLLIALRLFGLFVLKLQTYTVIYWWQRYMFGKQHIAYPNLFSWVQFSSVAQSCPTLCDAPWIAARQASLSVTISWSSPKLTSIKLVMPSSHAIQPSHPLSSPSPPVPNPSQNQSLFQWVNSLHEVAKVLEFQL